MNDELNPYQTPKTIDDSVEVKSQIPPVTRPMVNTKIVGGISRILLASFVGLCVVVAIWNFKLAYEYDITDEYEGLAFLSFDQMSMIENFYLYLFVGAILAVAFWKYKSMQNAWAMMYSGMQPTVSPGWSIAWYIIPVASLWKPFTAMSEINRNSMSDPKKLKRWLGFWWTFWLIGNAYDRITGSGEITDAGDLQHVAIGLLIIASAAVCLERIIANITKEQMAALDKKVASKM